MVRNDLVHPLEGNYPKLSLLTKSILDGRVFLISPLFSFIKSTLISVHNYIFLLNHTILIASFLVCFYLISGKGYKGSAIMLISLNLSPLQFSHTQNQILGLIFNMSLPMAVRLGSLKLLFNSFAFHRCCSVVNSWLTLCDSMNCSAPGFSVHPYLPWFAQTHVC